MKEGGILVHLLVHMLSYLGGLDIGIDSINVLVNIIIFFFFIERSRLLYLLVYQMQL